IYSEHLRCRAFGRRDLEQVGTAEESADFTLGTFTEISTEARDLMIVDHQYFVQAHSCRIELVGRDISYAIAEVIDVNYVSFDERGGEFTRHRHGEFNVVIYLIAHLCCFYPFAHPTGDRAKDIAPVKSRADRHSIVVFGIDLEHSVDLFVLVDVAEDPVVRADKIIVIGHHYNRSARRADTRIDYCKMKRETRKRRASVPQSERCGKDILRRDLVRDVDNLN